MLNTGKGYSVKKGFNEVEWAEALREKERLALAQARAEVRDLLYEVSEFLDNYVDVLDGDEGHPRPNKAMRLVSEIEIVIERLKRLDATDGCTSK